MNEMRKIFQSIVVLFLVFSFQVLYCTNPLLGVPTGNKSVSEYSEHRFEQLTVQAWKGNGKGGKFTESSHINEQIFYADSHEKDSVTAIVADTSNIQLTAGRYYSLSATVRSKNVTNFFDFIVALRE